MKVTRVSEHIWSLKAWLLVPIHVWVVVEEKGITLVDAGMPFMAKEIKKFLKEMNTGPLQRILLTHGHVDHVGAINSILSESEVPVYAHPVEIPYMEGEILYPKRKKLEFNVQKGVAQSLLEDEFGNLRKIGSLTPYWTPGHSPGHVVYYHEEDQVLLAGDLFNSKRGKICPPMFTPNMAEAVKSSAIVEKLKPTRLEVCHGSTVSKPVEQLKEYVRKMEKKLGNSL